MQIDKHTPFVIDLMKVRRDRKQLSMLPYGIISLMVNIFFINGVLFINHSCLKWPKSCLTLLVFSFINPAVIYDTTATFEMDQPLYRLI